MSTQLERAIAAADKEIESYGAVTTGSEPRYQELLYGPNSDMPERVALKVLEAVTPRTIITVEELDALPRNSIVAVLTHSRNVPITVVFQRGSNSEGGGGWCTPEAMGQITSEQVFEYIGLNCLPYEFTVLYEPTA